MEARLPQGHMYNLPPRWAPTRAGCEPLQTASLGTIAGAGLVIGVSLKALIVISLEVLSSAALARYTRQARLKNYPYISTRVIKPLFSIFTKS
jgi:hypothetical protein